MRSFKHLIAASVFLFAGPLGQTALAADASAGLDVATAYVFRGVTVNDRWVAQPYMELSGIPKVDGLSLGVWGNFDLETGSGGSPDGGEFSEVDLYTSYELPLGLEVFAASVGYTEYVYPGSEADGDKEVNLVLSLDTLLSPTLGVYYGVGGGIEQQVFIAAAIGHEHELTEDWKISGSGSLAGLFQPEHSEADDGISYVQLSAGIAYKCISATVNFIIETDDDVTVVDEDIYGVLGISGEF